MKFVIDRSKWRAGGGDYPSSQLDNKIGKGDTSLRNPEGFMCCLGQIACQLGVKKNKIEGNGEPSDLCVKLPALTIDKGEDDYFPNSKLSKQAMMINDDDKLTLKERERKLKSLFSKFHHTLIFKGKPVVSKT